MQIRYCPKKKEVAAVTEYAIMPTPHHSINELRDWLSVSGIRLGYATLKVFLRLNSDCFPLFHCFTGLRYPTTLE